MGLLNRMISKVVNKAADAIAEKAGNEIKDAILGDAKKRAEEAEESLKEAEEAIASAQKEAEKAAEEFMETTAYQRPALLVKHQEDFSVDDSAKDSDVKDRSSAAYFEDVITKNIEGVTVKTDVDPAEFAPAVPEKHEKALIVYKAETPVLAILLVSKDKYRNLPVINSMNALEAAGIPAIRFMKEFSNIPGYVIGRIKAVMK